MISEFEKVKCKYCSADTENTGTRLCDPCWIMSKSISNHNIEPLGSAINDLLDYDAKTKLIAILEQY